MNKRRLWVVLLSIIGLLAMMIGALDPLEGAFIILPGSGLIALGSFLSQSRHHKFIYCAFGLTVLGVVVIIVWSLFGGVGGNTGRSTWWLLTALPYPVGWFMSLVGAVHLLVSSFRKHSYLTQKSHS